LAIFAIGSVAEAATGRGTLTISGNGLGVVTITLSSAAFTLGSGTSVATAALGTISKKGTAPTGWTKGTVPNGWKLTAPVTVTTAESLTGSTDAMLSAQVLTVQSGVTWKVDGIQLSTTDQNIVSEPYGAHGHNVIIEIADSVANGTVITNTITFTATSQ
jgi:hypothetical protein